jgi:hypothetical protein
MSDLVLQNISVIRPVIRALCELGAVAHTYNPSYMGDGNRLFEVSLGKKLVKLFQRISCV